MAHGIAHIVWNVFLAAVAVGLALAIPPLARKHRARNDQLLAPALVSVVVLWLLFLPNTCYLFTELRHLFEAIDEGDLWTRAHGEGGAKAQLAIRLAVAALYTGAGALSFGAAIRPVRLLAEQHGFRTRRWLPFFFVVVALGVYLGLVLRFNSWDAFSDTSRVVSAAVTVTTRRALTLVVGGLGLWAIYEIIEVWLDGALARWSRRTGARASV
jgi:uncharacterized membrane protein